MNIYILHMHNETRNNIKIPFKTEHRYFTTAASKHSIILGPILYNSKIRRVYYQFQLLLKTLSSFPFQRLLTFQTLLFCKELLNPHKISCYAYFI